MTWKCANESCAQPLRRVNVRAEDAPGTLQYAARGLCKRCYNHGTDTLTPQQLKQAQTALDAWLNARRNRLRSKEAPCQQTKTESVTPRSEPARPRSGTAKPTTTQVVVARHGDTTRVTRNRPTRNAPNMGFEWSRS